MELQRIHESQNNPEKEEQKRGLKFLDFTASNGNQDIVVQVRV